ncbi:VWA domain-containing protein [Bradyrhizobium sp. G127]|uniref:nitric oxide reductase activation protein NorD n=1 Tax=Bradyrhizobium sp. G127 TaxID=2904800 RepID=UPI001F3A5837|nr:VWA domain-containing protein [Bradyrhizobium sp. G127]
MTATAASARRSIGAASTGAKEQLQSLMQQRETLRPPFNSALNDLAARFDADDLEEWALGVLRLAHVNVGPTCLLGFWNASKSQPSQYGIAPLVTAAATTADVCRHAGGHAAAATISAFVIARNLVGFGTDLSRWWRTMERLAREAPESVEAAATHMGTTLPAGDIAAFENFVAAGLKVAGGNRQRRLSFFSLEDEFARRLVARSSTGLGFADVEREIKAFATALWGQPPLLRAMAPSTDPSSQRRSTLSGPLIQLPEFYRGIQGDAARTLYRAATAHAQAHLVYGGARFPLGSLKPLQVALVSLIEDARVERLAMRELPGLRRLWSQYHVALPSGVATAPTLLARLARSLFDPSYSDDDGFVSKGRRLFEGAAPRMADPAISREIGMLLGNDLGQMRVQFNAKTYVTEPIYRDDGMGLWDFGENASPPEETLDIATEAARVEPKNDPDGDKPDNNPTADDGDMGRARPIVQDERGIVIAKYPEWDRIHGMERPEWTTVREVPAPRGDSRSVDAALDRAEVLRNRVRQLIRGVRVGRTIRLKRQFDGHDLDVDAMNDAGIALRMKQEPDPRIFRSSTSKHRDLAVLLLIDISESTRDRLSSGATILDVERIAVALLSEAMNVLGDPFCLLAFASNGRDDVQMTTVKTFEQGYDRDCVRRLAGLSSGLSTRLGTALRHAGETISRVRSYRKLVIVLTDGEPSDIDVTDSQDLIEDARRAAAGLKGRGIDGFGVVLNQREMGAAARIFGRGNTMLVHRVEDLPGRLSELYFRLARR